MIARQQGRSSGKWSIVQSKQNQKKFFKAKNCLSPQKLPGDIIKKGILIRHYKKKNLEINNKLTQCFFFSNILR